MSTGIDDDTDWRSERGEWHDALDNVLKERGKKYVVNLLRDLQQYVSRRGLVVTEAALNTPYRNTIPPEREEKSPGNRELEHKIRSAIRWNAVAIILRANKESSELGGHIASFQSAALLYDIGFGHFWHAPSDNHGGPGS